MYVSVFVDNAFDHTKALDLASLDIDRLLLPNRVLCEKPQIYRGSKQKGDPNDLIDVAISAAQFLGKICTPSQTHWVLPAAWKGQLSKPICHHRIWMALTEAERRLLPTDTVKRIDVGLRGGPYEWEYHNHLDAIGIGLVAVGRVSKF